MSIASRVVKNSGFLFLASFVNNLMMFFLTLFTARFLGTYNFGLISSGTSLVGIFGVFCDLGLSTYAIQQVSRDKSLIRKYFGTTLVLRIICSLVTLIVYSGFVIVSGFTFEGMAVMLLLGIYMVINSLVGFYYSLFQSNEKMQYQTIANIIYSTSLFLIMVILLFSGASVIVVAGAYAVASFLSLLYAMFIKHKNYPKFSYNFDKSFMKELITNGVPFGITSIFT